MNGIDVYFSDFFCVDEELIENYGAVNISWFIQITTNYKRIDE